MLEVFVTLAMLPWLHGFGPSSAGDRRVTATFQDGITLYDHDRVVAHAPGFTPQGSADEIVSLTVGDAWIGAPVLALAATSGGHNENTTWLTLYRLDTLTPVWSGEVEHHEGTETREGLVLLYPGGMVYRTPNGDTQLWRFDPDQKRFINRGTFGVPEV